MNNIIRLIKLNIQNTSVMEKIRQPKDTKAKLKWIGIFLFAVFVSCSVIAAVVFYNIMLGYSFAQINMLHLLPALMMAVSSIFALVTTIYKGAGVLFNFQDYDGIMSLPIKAKDIVVSRIVILYAMNIFFILIVMLPMAVVYGILASPGVSFYVNFVVTLLFIPLIPIILATVIGIAVQLIAARFRYKNIVAMVLMISAFLAFMGFTMSAGDSVEMIGEIGVALTNSVNRIYPLAGIYMQSVCYGSVIDSILFIGLSVAAFVIFVWFVSHFFTKMHTVLSSVSTRSNYKLVGTKTSTPVRALYIKELKRFFSSPLYMMNTGVGMILSTAACIALCFMDLSQLDAMMEIPGFARMLPVAAPIFLSFFIVMTYTSACSISLEGRHLWILRSLPIDTMSIFRSKILVNLTVILPFLLVDCVLLSVILKTDILGVLLVFAIPLIFTFYTAIMGLVVNLLLPNLGWSNEVSVIKQSAASLVAMFAGMLPVLASGALVIVFPQSALTTVLGTGILMIAITLLLYLFLKRRGTVMFEQL